MKKLLLVLVIMFTAGSLYAAECICPKCGTVFTPERDAQLLTILEQASHEAARKADEATKEEWDKLRVRQEREIRELKKELSKIVKGIQ